MTMPLTDREIAEQRLAIESAMLDQLIRIAEALEAANRADPLLALQQALEPASNDPDADMPPHIRRAVGR